MILVAIGSNLSGPWGSPRQTVERAIHALNQFPLHLLAQSSLLHTKAYGLENQPDFVNAVVQIETALAPHVLLRKLHMIEREAGRKRGRRWGPRTLDLDLIDYHGLKRTQRGHVQKALVLPHPGLPLRDFVLKPIAEIAPRWRHATNHKTASALLARLH